MTVSDNGQDTFTKRFSEHVSRQDPLGEDSVSTFQVEKEIARFYKGYSHSHEACRTICDQDPIWNQVIKKLFRAKSSDQEVHA